MRLRALLASVVFVAHCASAVASTTCTSTAYGPLCTSQVNFSQFLQRAYQTQQASEWCWAASISMIFSFYGHPVAQPRIVQEAYGTVANVPAVAGSVMAQALNRTWTDDRGSEFHSSVRGLYDPAAGVSTLDNNQLIRELDQNRPFIVGTNGHAMVVTEMTYYQTQYGPYIVEIGVFDPWPTSGGARTLSAAEATPVTQGGTMTFLATTAVGEGNDSAGANPFSKPGGGMVDPSLLLPLVAAALLLRRRR
jgi:hypothetical protein